MNFDHTWHTATRLLDGRVLVAAGYVYGWGYDNVSASCEIFDPATNTWTPVAPMHHARFTHQAVLLNDGRVFVAGGWGPGGNTIAGPPEIYDPAANTWTDQPTAPPYGLEGYARAAKLGDGRVLITEDDWAWIFDPATASYTTLPNCPRRHDLGELVALADGRVMAVGTDDIADIYDPVTNSWTPTLPMSVAREESSVTRLADGRIYVLGGYQREPYEFLASAEIYDPATNAWTPAAGTPAVISGHAAALMTNGQVLIAANHQGFVNTELAPAISLTSAAGTLSSYYVHHTATPLLDGRVLVAAGRSAELYTPPRVPLAPDQPRASGAGSKNKALKAADLDGDGRADLVVLTDTAVYSLLGQGSGTFGSARRYSNGTTPVALATGDFNGDGTLDLAVANRGSSNVTVRLGRGDGSFRASAQWAAGAEPVALVVADVNGDGRSDIAVAGGGASPTVSVLLGNGGNSFQAPVSYALPALSDAAHLAAGDFNGDGRVDLAVASGASPSGATALLLGQPGGTLAAGASLSAGVQIGGLSAGDLDGDGDLDLAVAGSARAVLMGNGNGTFGSPVILGAAPGGDTGIELADLDGDHDLDIAASNGATGNAEILRNQGLGVFAAETTQSLGDVGPTAVSAGDLDGDGRNDLVFTSARFGLHALRSDGASGFGPRVDSGFGVGVIALASADLDGNGLNDVVVANEGSRNVSVLLNHGGQLGAATNVMTGGDQITSVVAADLNGDGRPDLAATAQGSRTLHVALNKGDGTFGAASVITSSTSWSPTDVKAGDLNGDGRVDLVVAGYSGKGLFVLRGRGDGTFLAPARTSMGSLYPRAVALTDVNGDGRLDAVTANYSGNSISVLLGNGAGGFGSPTSYTSTGMVRPYALAVKDLNGDGIRDVAVATYGSLDVRLFLGNAAGAFTPGSTFAIGEAVRAVVAEDLTGDGVPDLAAVSSTSSLLHLWKGSGGALLAEETRVVGRSPRSVIAADLNGDSRLDLVVGGYGSNDVTSLFALAH